MKRYFNKRLVMPKEHDEDLENVTECQICDNVYVKVNVKLRVHCHTTGKYGGSAHRDCNIKVKLIHEIS